MTFKALHTGHPLYLTDQLQYYQPTRSVRSSGTHQLVKPRHNLSFGSRSAPHIWNSLPTNIREGRSVLTFKRHLKTHYFQWAFFTPTRPDFQRTWTWSLFDVARPYVCLSVTLVHPTQVVEIFGNISTALGTLAIHWHPLKFYGDRPRGTLRRGS